MSEQRATAPAELPSATSALAAYSSQLKYADLPAPVREFAKHCLLDWMGVAIAGSRDETGVLVLAEAREQGGAPQATVVGYGDKTSMMQAALVNGTFSHALDYDDVNGALTGHPTVPVAPVVLALAQWHGLSGQAVIEAFVAGVEVECRIGRLLTEDHYERGFHATGTIGTIGAAAAAARLLGLDAQRTAVAFGIAATQSAGLKSMFGTMCKPLHAGKAAANGLYAASMAARGFSARADVLECDQGFTATHTGSTDEAGALNELGVEFLTSNTLFKYHAACYGTHATIKAARRIRDTHALSPANIKGYEVKVPLSNLRMCDIVAPTTGLQAKFSLRMTAAMALAGENTAAIDNYSEATCQNPELVALTNVATVVGDARQGKFQAEVTVRTNDGVVYRESADAGVPEADLERQAMRLREKFDALVTPIVGAKKGARLAAALLDLDAADNAGQLMADAAS